MSAGGTSATSQDRNGLPLSGEERYSGRHLDSGLASVNSARARAAELDLVDRLGYRYRARSRTGIHLSPALGRIERFEPTQQLAALLRNLAAHLGLRALHPCLDHVFDPR